MEQKFAQKSSELKKHVVNSASKRVPQCYGIMPDEIELCPHEVLNVSPKLFVHGHRLHCFSSLFKNSSLLLKKSVLLWARSQHVGGA